MGKILITKDPLLKGFNLPCLLQTGKGVGLGGIPRSVMEIKPLIQGSLGDFKSQTGQLKKF
jgi:hypothetical protein